MKSAALVLAILPLLLASAPPQDAPAAEPEQVEPSQDGHHSDDIPTLEQGYGMQDPEPSTAAYGVQADEQPVYADGWPVWRHDGVLPSGLAHGSLVDTGQFGLELRYSQTEWKGMRDGREDRSSQYLFDAGYGIAGTELTENRLELDFLYGLSPRWILYATLPIIERELSYDMAAGGSRREESSGLGDLILGGRYSVSADDQHQLQYTIGLGLPTGDYNQRGSYAGNSNVLLPYALQLGTGTVDVYPGITYLRLHEEWTLGARGEARLHIGRNSDHWAVSDSLEASVWASKTLNKSVTGDVRLEANWWGDYHGTAPGFDRLRSPLEDSSRQGGSLVQLVFGLAVDLSNSYAGSNRLGIEVGVPIDEWVDGPGFSRETSLLISWRLGL